EDAVLRDRIVAIHAAAQGTYGAPRIHAELAAEGIHLGRKRVARLMRAQGLAGVSRRRFATTTVRDGARPAPDLIDRTFTADRPNALWVADITYVPTWVGFVYLAVVLDAFSRRIVGWSMATTLATKLVLDALDMALWQRRPKDVIHHSDQGSQYTSLAFGNRCREAGVRPSMGSVGDAYDNAMAESFFATLECELLERRRLRPTPRRRWQSSSLSRASTISAVGTLPSAICHRPTSSAATREAHFARAHPSLPPCSRPARRGLKASKHEERSERRPSLTGAARDGQYDVRAGTKERAPQGPNKRTGPRKETGCRQIM